MLKIALTGNIASGKSQVEEFLKKDGYKTLCLDEVTSLIYENDSDFKVFLLNTFNTFDKKDISKIVFSSKENLKKLENVIYPKIKDKMNIFFEENKEEAFVFVSAPMLFECGFDKYFDKIIFVSADKSLRLKRLIKRNNYDIDYAKLRINSQQDEEDKIKKSDFVILNNTSKENLYTSYKRVIKDINTLL